MPQTAALDPLVTDDLEQRFEALVVSHRDKALRLAWRLVGGDDAAAQDVVQDAFVNAYRGLARFRGEASLSTWFYQIVVRQAHNYRRWRSVRELWTTAQEEDPPDPVAKPVGDPALQRRITTALDSLSRRQREAFVLVHMEGFTAREAGELMGTREGSVKSHVHRARQNLRRDLADLANPGDDQ